MTGDSFRPAAPVVDRPMTDPTVPPANAPARPDETATLPPATEGGGPTWEGGLPAALPFDFGRYRLLKELGRGGMGAVYLAHDTQLDRQVALKIPLFSDAAGTGARERFLREARAAATLSHPNLCPVHDTGQIDGVYFLTMAFIEGKSLADLIREGKSVAPRTAAMLVRQLALAMPEAASRAV